jgi:uncharacterized protein HemX
MSYLKLGAAALVLLIIAGLSIGLFYYRGEAQATAAKLEASERNNTALTQQVDEAKKATQAVKDNATRQNQISTRTAGISKELRQLECPPCDQKDACTAEPADDKGKAYYEKAISIYNHIIEPYSGVQSRPAGNK